MNIKTNFRILALMFSLWPTALFAEGTSKSLTEQLREKAEASAEKSPKEVRKIMLDALDDLKNEKIQQQALKKGDKMPEFELPDVTRGMIDSESLLKKGPLVVVFYRGGWCPYCNLQLRDIQNHIQKFQKLGAQVVAISPEAPDQSRETVKKNTLDFYVLSDLKGSVAKSFGLTFKLPPDLKTLYKKFGIDLQKHNANKKWELPLAATYIVKPNSEVIYSFVDVDYKKRAETEDLIKVLKAAKSTN